MGRWSETAAVEKESMYPACIHPSFSRKTLPTLQESMNRLSFDLHEVITWTEEEDCIFGILLAPQLSCYSAC